MVVENGVISPKIKTGGGLDGKGNPVRPGFAWGDPVECNIKVNKNSLVGKSNGNTFTIASYEILVEATEWEAESVKLAYSSGKELGEFSLLSEPEILQAVGMVKLLV
jgi:hypothetical protein